jgi:hypothetical protein
MPARTRRLALLGCFMLGVGLRTVRLVEWPLIHPDGPGYIQSARTLDGNHWAAALAGYYPPGLPVAMRAIHGLGPDWEASGRLVAFAAGATAVPLTGALAQVVLADGAAVGAALLAAVNPRMVRASVEVLPETLYGLFVLVWALLLFGDASATRVAAAAAVAALAYLVRAEGILLVPLTAIAAGADAPPRSRLGRLALVAVVAAVVLVPLTLAVSRETGVWELSGKEMPLLARRYGVEGTGLLGAVTRHPSALLASFPHALAQQVGYTLGVVHALLLVPLAVGLAMGLTGGAPRRARRLTLVTVGAFTLAIALVNPGKRYVVPLVPLLLPWIVVGARRLAALASDGSLGRRATAVVGWAPIVVGVGLVALGLSGVEPPKRAEERCLHGLCSALVERFGRPLPPFVTEDGRIAYLCGARFVPEPRGGGIQAVAASARAAGGGLWVAKRRVPAPTIADGIVPVAERCGVSVFEIRPP